MSKKNKKIVFGGIFCVLLLLISTWYAITFNEARLVVPTDLSSYTFQAKDLPMIISMLLLVLYVIGLVVALCFHVGKKVHGEKESNITRELHPKMGFLALLGFLGFGGFWSYQVDGSVFPFVFFLFFGFAGFFFEGKMSGTFMDERFKENAIHAQLAAFRISLSIIFIALIVLCQGKLFGSLENSFIALIIVLSLSLGLGLFLSEYLLYRYDHDEQYDENEE